MTQMEKRGYDVGQYRGHVLRTHTREQQTRKYGHAYKTQLMQHRSPCQVELMAGATLAQHGSGDSTPSFHYSLSRTTAKVQHGLRCESWGGDLDVPQHTVQHAEEWHSTVCHKGQCLLWTVQQWR